MNAPRPPHKRNRTAAEYSAAIRLRESDLRIAREFLEQWSEAMAEVHREFRAQRSQLLRAIGQAMKRPQRSALDLKFSRSGKIGSPRAVWRTYVRLKQDGTKRPLFLNGAIRHRRKSEWTRKELASHAHPAELDLVMETEAKLVWLRKRVLPLQKAAKRLSTAVTQLKKELSRAQSRERALTTNQRSVDVRLKMGQIETRTSDEETRAPVRPQFRYPDGVL